jgi:hypothetical protein
MMDRNKQIKSFISNIIDKNYAAANKELKGVVEGKLKEKIAKATKKDLF